MATLKSPHRTPILRPFLHKTLTRKRKIFPYTAVSNVTSYCPRAYYFAHRFKGREFVQEFQTQMHFILGAIAEDFVERLFKAAGVSVLAKEVEIDFTELPSSYRTGISANGGRIDFFHRMPNNKYYLAEVKKMNSNRFNYFKTRGLHAEQSAHFQLLYYLHAWEYDRQNGEDIPKVDGLLIGISVDPPDIIDTTVEYSKEDFNAFKPQLEVLEAYRIAFDELSKTKDPFDIDPPPRPDYLNIESYQCGSCSFFQECYNEYPNDINTSHLTKHEIEVLNKAIVQLRQAYYMRKDLDLFYKVASDTIKGLMQNKEAKSLEFASTVGELNAVLTFVQQEKLDASSLIKNHADLIKRYTKKTTKWSYDFDIKLSREMERLAARKF